MKIRHAARGLLGVHTSFTMVVLWTKDDIAVDTRLLASSCRWSRRKRASAFFFHFEASPTPTPISTAFPLKLTFFGPLAGWAEGPASFAEASAILLAFWAEVEGPVGRIGASGVGGTTTGDGLVFGGFWPAVFLLLCAKSQIRTSQLREGVKSKEYLPNFRSGSLILACNIPGFYQILNIKKN
jgi:hypothetical protein